MCYSMWNLCKTIINHLQFHVIQLIICKTDRKSTVIQKKKISSTIHTHTDSMLSKVKQDF